jgi:hypothetical protein
VPLDRVRLTAAKSGLGRHRKLRLARPQGSAPGLGSGIRRTPPRPTPGLGLGLGSRRRRTPPRPTQGSNSASTPEDDELRLARPQGSDSALALDDGLRLARPRAQTRPRPRRSLHLPQPRARANHVIRGTIITLPLASSGYREQDRRPIWLAPVNK